MRLFVVTTIVAVLAALATSVAFAGEITGNGTPKWTNTDRWTDPVTGDPIHHTLNGNSPCAFSGQEDNQFQGTPGNLNPDFDPNAGHSQNWGHTKQAADLTGGAGPAGCNGHLFGTNGGAPAP
jgi:hypothetical protein